MTQPSLSIVIPAYNEAARIGNTLEKVLQYCESGSRPTELVIVDDGSTDSTPELLKDFQKRWPATRILRNEPNRGKGFSVRRGVLEAQGEFVLFSDADLSAPIEETDRLLAAMDSLQADAVVGSRAINRQLIGIHQPIFRELSGRFFNLCVRLSTGLKIHDTQCGLKLFRRASTRRAFELQRVDGFGFDPELLFLIERRGGKIVEVPVRWDNNPATKVRFLHDATKMFFDLVALRWRAATGKYEDSRP
ncbi:MAG TPA: dolichyl-phosphate beta-glucosyltransferase [Terriglobia bacterium]|nr:dolichyl-phosphate beta-glucosyltransferase [Terriglobia bacterium]